MLFVCCFMRFGWAVLYVSEKQFILSAIVVERQTEEGVCRDVYIYVLYVDIYLPYSFSCICAENSFQCMSCIYLFIYYLLFSFFCFKLVLRTLLYIYLIYTCAYVSFLSIYICFFYIFVLSTLAYFVTHTPRRTWQLTLKTDRCWIVEFCAPTGTRWCLIMKAASTLSLPVSLSFSLSLTQLFVIIIGVITLSFGVINYTILWCSCRCCSALIPCCAGKRHTLTHTCTHTHTHTHTRDLVSVWLMAQAAAAMWPRPPLGGHQKCRFIGSHLARTLPFCH